MNDGYSSNLSVLMHMDDLWVKVANRSTITDREHYQSFHLVLTSFPNAAAHLQAQCDTPWIRPDSLGQVCVRNSPGVSWVPWPITSVWADTATAGTRRPRFWKGSSTLARPIPLKIHWLLCFSPNWEIYKSTQDAHPKRNGCPLAQGTEVKGISWNVTGFRRKTAPRAGDIGSRSPGRDWEGEKLTGLSVAAPNTPSVQRGPHTCAVRSLSHSPSTISAGAGDGSYLPTDKISRDS